MAAIASGRKTNIAHRMAWSRMHARRQAQPIPSFRLPATELYRSAAGAHARLPGGGAARAQCLVFRTRRSALSCCAAARPHARKPGPLMGPRSAAIPGSPGRRGRIQLDAAAVSHHTLILFLRPDFRKHRFEQSRKLDMLTRSVGFTLTSSSARIRKASRFCGSF